MEDTRTPFQEAVNLFRKFAADNGKSLNFLWISQDRVCVVGGRVWIFRPDEVQGDVHAERFYESVRTGDSSIKLMGIFTLGNRYVTCVEEMPAPPHYPKQLYMSLFEDPRFQASIVTSRPLWGLLHMIPSVFKRDHYIIEAISLDRTIKSA